MSLKDALWTLEIASDPLGGFCDARNQPSLAQKGKGRALMNSLPRAKCESCWAAVGLVLPRRTGRSLPPHTLGLSLEALTARNEIPPYWEGNSGSLRAQGPCIILLNSHLSSPHLHVLMSRQLLHSCSGATCFCQVPSDTKSTDRGSGLILQGLSAT